MKTWGLLLWITIELCVKDFPKFFPGHKDKEELAERVLREGIYLARICDDTFVLVQDDDFKPRSFNV